MIKSPFLETEIPDGFCFFGIFFIICKNHSAFTSSNNLICIKTKTTYISKTPAFFTFILCTMSFCSIFNNNQVIFICYFYYWVHITWMPIYMNRHNCSCFFRNFFLNLRNINCKCSWL